MIVRNRTIMKVRAEDRYGTGSTNLKSIIITGIIIYTLNYYF
jgi:hypothetical protein